TGRRRSDWTRVGRWQTRARRVMAMPDTIRQTRMKNGRIGAAVCRGARRPARDGRSRRCKNGRAGPAVRAWSIGPPRGPGSSTLVGAVAVVAALLGVAALRLALVGLQVAVLLVTTAARLALLVRTAAGRLLAVAALLLLAAGRALLALLAALRAVAILPRRLLPLLVLVPLHVMLLGWVAPPFSGGDGLRRSSEVVP